MFRGWNEIETLQIEVGEGEGGCSEAGMK